MKKVLRLLLSLMFYGLTGIGISLTIKAGIGISSFNSLNVALAWVLHFKVGMVTIMLNGLFLMAYMLLSNFRHPIKYVSQAVAVICLGGVIDLFTAKILGSLLVQGYPMQLLIFVLGTCIAGAFTGMVLNLEVMAFPIESACALLAEKTGVAFHRIRYGVDILSVAGSVLLSLIFSLPLFVREGTIISLFLLTAAISLTKKVHEKSHAVKRFNRG
ncbi:hypothetical protein [Desulfitobacterium chlororespirans]|uniref:Uncharacterized membrane protein YczE n=1 Tax=Desulfitobacterium chlororespirans DSM 11544 TaxID=1121395 RepID=A0A1M7UZ24_9FIRM|nr:hypothetical protein [Desulfitobacterium chlororespirans]SHN88218.1 Uncharacterized membrane protein YczE [Desulfitobacterium chlororespirans DSM 11544]